MPMKTLKKDQTKQVLRYYWQQVRHYPKYMIGVAISIPFTVLVNTFLPTLIAANVLSRLSQHHYQANDLWGSFGPQLTAYVILLLVGIMLWRTADSFAWRLEARIQRDMAEEVFGKLVDQSANFHANSFAGSLVSQNSKLLGSYVRIADTTIFQVYPLVASILLAVGIMAFRAPLFAGLLLLFSVIYLTIAIWASQPVRRVGSRYAAAESKQTGFLADALTNSMAIKSFAAGNFERKRFTTATSETNLRLQEFAAIHRRQMNVLGFTSRIISGISLTVAVLSVMVFHANIGTVFLILSYTASVVEQLFTFGNNSLRSYNRAFGDASDMVEILNLQPEVLDPAKPEASHISKGAIEFKDVTFSHDGADDAIFEHFNIRIKPGEKIGLVGHSGSGKTTFTRLLLRFSDLDGGEILIDGQNVAKIAQDDLRSNIAYVPQEPLLFHRTIRENIGYGDPEASDKDIVKVAKLAHADEFVRTLPHGYDTLVGERGVKLSGGQRQRIAIARAMIKRAPILVLDEATSALDSESERLIQASLKDLMAGRTAIVIAHRLSTIQKMDRIVVLDDGAIVEQGSHRELLAAGGTYAKLWAHQSGGFMDD
jgi:ATP-binding cassette subfamily B protein